MGEMAAGFLYIVVGLVIVIAGYAAILFGAAYLFVFLIRFRFGLLGLGFVIGSYWLFHDKSNFNQGIGLFFALIGLLMVLSNVKDIINNGLDSE